MKIDLALIGDSITHGWESGEKDVWNPVKQQMIGGSEKNRAIMKRPMRSPWTL